MNIVREEWVEVELKVVAMGRRDKNREQTH